MEKVTRLESAKAIERERSEESVHRDILAEFEEKVRMIVQLRERIKELEEKVVLTGEEREGLRRRMEDTKVDEKQWVRKSEYENVKKDYLEAIA